MLRRNRATRMAAWLLAATLLIGIMGYISPATARAAADRKICIVLDPGHGGNDPGAVQEQVVSGAAVSVREKDLALKVAEYTRQRLEEDGRFVVYLTREQDQKVSLDQRAEFARDKEADLLLSLQFNSASSRTAGGAEIWQSVLPQYHILALPMKILLKIHEKTGISAARGVKSRKSESKTYWNAAQNWDTDKDTGTMADYYALIKGAAKWGICAMIVEQAFMTNEADMKVLMKPDDEGLKALAEANAEALIEFYTNHEHFYEVQGTEYPVSCISPGRRGSYCMICKAKKDIAPLAGTVDANAHFVDAYTVEAKATTNAEGREKGTCHYCGATVTRTITKLLSPAPKPSPSPKPKKPAASKVTPPAKVVVAKANKGKKNKKVTITVKKVTGAAGYYLLAGSNKTLSKGKKQVFRTGTKFELPRWKGKYCYFKVCAYKKDTNGKKIYGAWSSVRRLA